MKWKRYLKEVRRGTSWREKEKGQKDKGRESTISRNFKTHGANRYIYGQKDEILNTKKKRQE